MTANQFRAAIASLGLSQSGLARLFGVAPRTVRYWAAGDVKVPGPAVILLRLLLDRSVKKEKIEKITIDR